MNGIEGQLRIGLYPEQATAERVQIRSSRPVLAAGILVGKTPQQALDIIPLLFNICATAQARVALLAMQNELGTKRDVRMEAARDILVLVENAREHLLRLFLDWPGLFDLDSDNNNLPYLGQLLTDFRRALFSDGNAFDFDSRLQTQPGDTTYLIDKLEAYLSSYVFGCTCRQWLQLHDFTELQNWAQETNTLAAQSLHRIYKQGWASQGASCCPPLPELDDDELYRIFENQDADEFVARPQWQGQCHETTALTRQLEQPLIQALQRQFNNSLITRWTARLVELARIPQQLHALLTKVVQAPKTAVTTRQTASIEAARGRLIHHVRIEHGLIRHYRILAPTEWNFHPRGLVVQTLGSITESGHHDLDKLAHIMINAIDPCVGYELRIH